jgi:CDGSH-type Zn-finger protein
MSVPAGHASETVPLAGQAVYAVLGRGKVEPMADDVGDMRIDVTADGPYRVSGSVPLVRAEIVTDDAGESVAWRETERIEHPDTYILCRCGASKHKPFCDSSHVVIDFDGTETAEHDRYFQTAAEIPGPGLALHDVRKLCAEARFCDHRGGLWNLIEHCDDPEIEKLVEQEAANCPSGRYVVCDADGTPIEPKLEPSIALVEDPSLGVSGPLWVRGGIPVFSAEGEQYEVRNRVTLCRCGASKNKPFCDGSHIKAGFTDES